MGGVFICYRRADSSDITGRLYDRLVRHFGRANVFKDVFSIDLGQELDAVITAALAKSDVLLVVIGDRWDVTRLREPDDPVRREIELAMANDVRIIPLFVRGGRMASREDLPPSLERFAFFNGMPLRDDPDFDNDVLRLLRSLDPARRWRRRALLVPPVLTAVSLAAWGIGRLVDTEEPRAPRAPADALRAETAAAPPKPPPPGMVWLPPVTATLGSTREEIDALRDRCSELAPRDICAQLEQHGVLQRELPRRDLRIEGFFLDRGEVTIDEFATWLSDVRAQVNGEMIELDGYAIARTGAHGVLLREGNRYVPRAGLASLPIVEVTWEGAMRFCSARGATLPTGAQWERAARGTAGARFPWGDEPPACTDAVLGRSVGRCPGAARMEREGTAPRDRTAEGLHDLVGNVSEWVRDSGPTASEHEVRGGSYASVWLLARPAARRFVAGSAADVGFRCAMSVGGE